jgi:hypothetical protein
MMSDEKSNGRIVWFQIAWVWGVAFAPFMLIVIFRGWDETFRSGEAYLYLIGVTVAVLGEVGIELAENGTKGIKSLPLDDKIGAIIELAVVLAAAAWGAVLVVTQPRIHNPTTSWVQVVIFFLALSYLTATRFAPKGMSNLSYGSSSGNGDQSARRVETVVDDQPGVAPAQEPVADPRGTGNASL